MAYGVGASLGNMGLVGQGQKQQADATAMLADAAKQEQDRNLANERAEAARKQGNQQLGATAGAMAGMTYGSSLGPWGAVIGGLAGGIAGGLF